MLGKAGISKKRFHSLTLALKLFKPDTIAWPRCRSCAMLVRQGHGPKRVRNQGGKLGQVNS